jgi:hypothetical protein
VKRAEGKIEERDGTSITTTCPAINSSEQCDAVLKGRMGGREEEVAGMRPN